MYERQEMARLAEKPHDFKRTKLIFLTIGTATYPKQVLYEKPEPLYSWRNGIIKQARNTCS